MENCRHFVTPPILFVVFNRIETVKKTLAAIRQAAPSKIFIAADGPRATVPDEAEKCEAVRRYILENIDWDCEIKTRFPEKNLGCRKAVSSAVDWFFSEVEEGIILEDDCLPGKDFFRYAAAALEFYRDDPRVMHINGSCFALPSGIRESAFFYRYAHVWGWASWRRAWNHYDVDIKDFDPAILRRIFPDDRRQAARWHEILRNVIAEKPGFNTWDFQWTYTIMARGGRCLSPICNLISNIGAEQSTHNMESVANMLELQIGQLPEKILFPEKECDGIKEIENQIHTIFYQKSPLYKRVWAKLKTLFKQI